MPKPYTSPKLQEYGTIEEIQPAQLAKCRPQSPTYYDALAELYLLLYGNCYRIRSSPNEPYGPPIPGSPFT